MIKLVSKVFVIVLFSCLLAFVFNHYKTSPFSWAWNPPASVFPNISDFQTMQQLLSDPALVVIDVRDRLFYEAGHLPGARNWPLAEAERSLNTWLKSIPVRARVLLYCSDSTCHMAEDLATKMAAFNYLPTIYAPGFDGWEAAGGSIETMMFAEPTGGIK